MEKRTTTTFSENPFLNLVVNVLLPVLILKKAPVWMPDVSAVTVLAGALALPLALGLWDYLQARKKNYVSILGFLNTGLTGGLALLEVEGFWFALKEGILPLLIGVFVVVSLRQKRNFIEMFFFQPQLLDMDVIDRKVAELGKQQELKSLTQKATLLFSLSFLVSATLNLLIGLYIFTPISTELTPAARAHALNEQIAQMTWMGYLVIALPLTLGTGLLLWWMLKNTAKILHLNVEQMLKKS